MNKPAGYVCSAVSDSHKTVYELLTPELQKLVQSAKRGERLHTVGRLDCETGGLLFFTTDGNFSNRLTRPQSKISKTYRVTLKTPFDEQTFLEYKQRLLEGITLPPEKKAPEQQAAPADLCLINETTCQIKICEGKFHEVRRIFCALGNTVQKLERIAVGGLSLPADLPTGKYRPFTPAELDLFFDI